MYKRYLPYGIGLALLLTALLLVRTCSGRSVDGLQQALLGHWRASNGQEIYYAPGEAVAVAPEGTRSYHPWRVLMVNERDSWMKILIANSDGENVTRVLQFDAARTGYRASSAPGFSKGPGLSEAHWVDADQHP